MTWLQTSIGIGIDSQIVGQILGVLVLGLFAWNGWITMQLIKLTVSHEVFHARAGPVLDAIWRDLPALSLKTNPRPYTEREKVLIKRFERDPSQMSDEELEDLRRAYDAKRKDEDEDASYRTVAALMQGAVRGEIDTRRVKGWRRWLWSFR